jgi:hypothetical protein
MRISPLAVWHLLFSTWPGQVIVILVGAMVATAAIATGTITTTAICIPLLGCYAGARLLRRRGRRR